MITFALMENRRNTYGREEKLKSRRLIEKLFTRGKTVAKYPLRLVYLPVEETEELAHSLVGVSVSKRYFKRAADRNYYKRLLREAYRLNKYQLLDKLQKPHAFMILYQSKEQLNFEQVQEKLLQLIEKFCNAENLS